jgi:hypothetical protein
MDLNEIIGEVVECKCFEETEYPKENLAKKPLM